MDEANENDDLDIHKNNVCLNHFRRRYQYVFRPHHIAAGGVSGLGILLESALGFDRAMVILVLNIIMLVLALVFLGKNLFQSAF